MWPDFFFLAEFYFESFDSDIYDLFWSSFKLKVWILSSEVWSSSLSLRWNLTLEVRDYFLSSLDFILLYELVILLLSDLAVLSGVESLDELAEDLDMFEAWLLVF